MRGVVLAAAAAIACSVGARGQSPVVLNSSGIQAILRNGATVVSVPIANTSGRPVLAQLSLDWLLPNDTAGASATEALELPAGEIHTEVPLPLPSPSIWLRLRYRLTPGRTDPRAFDSQQGMVAISQIAPYIFEVKLGQAEAARYGAPFTVHVQAVHPATRAPVAGVEWTASMTVDGKRLEPAHVSPAEHGYVGFTFALPPTAGDDESEKTTLAVTAKNGDFVREESFEIPVEDHLSARLQTDKPIYQPGQTIHLRAVAFDNNRAANGTKFDLEIEDGQNQRVHAATLTSSRFGVVQDDWTLPEGAELGSYSIVLTKAGGYQQLGRQAIRVSRYELPEFNVSAKPDRTAYLPGQAASVEIRGTYLFGKPVPKGKVKIVRTGQGIWNPQTRSLDPDEKTISEGEADENGRYVTPIDLAKDYADLQVSNYTRYQDLHFAAYYTDPTSGRTEQMRFDVRVTLQPIHIYVSSGDTGNPGRAPVYISTFYADGRPAQTNVEITVKGTGSHVTAHSNSYGVAKAYLPLNASSDDEIELRAEDASGTVGTHSDRIFSYGNTHLRVDTDRTIFRTGEPVIVHVTSTRASGAVMVNAVAEDRSVAARVIQLINGKGEATFPYQPEFRKTVIFVGWDAEELENQYSVPNEASRAVIFPDGSDLRIRVAADKTTYRPGAMATLRLAVTSAGGQPVESALGVAVVDEAVTERTRTDAEFGRDGWFDCDFCGDPGGHAIGSVRLRDLYHLDPSKPVSPELDLVAEMLVSRDSARLYVEQGEDLPTGHVTAFANTFRAQMEQVKSILDRRYLQTLDYPRDEAALSSALGMTWQNLRDPWGTPYSARFRTQGQNDVMEIVSAGPDQRTGTADDFAIGSIERPYFRPAERLIRHILEPVQDLPASATEFGELLAQNGLELDRLRDPWGIPYRGSVRTFGVMRQVRVESAGPDRQFDTPDDVTVLYLQGSYFQRETELISRALGAAPEPPKTENDFRAILQRADIDLSALRDAWGHPYRLLSETRSAFTDRRDHTTVRVYGEAPFNRTEVTPVTRTTLTFSLHSDGPDGIDGTYDDFDIASFSVLLHEESAAPDKGTAGAPLPSGTGAIAGTVTDPAGAVIAGATVGCLASGGSVPRRTTTNSAGQYRLEGLGAGVYQIIASSEGFNTYRVSNIPVAEGQTTPVDVELGVGSTTETVTVTAGAPALQTESAELALSATQGISAAISTPRVRDYFPETLLWNPELITDQQGRAQLSFTLADSVTTWKVAAIASTIDGRIAETETDLRAFQPFFIDFNPPPLLTSGDRITLPVTIRNYLDHAQKVAVTLKTDSWSKLEGSAAQSTKVAANSSANAAYVIRAGEATDSAKERITAVAAGNHDAIEKSLHIHPDGQEVTQTFGDLAARRIAFSLPVPDGAVAGATRGELRLYPNALSILMESAGAILEAPHGCAEQTVSAGYANLIALRYARSIGANDPKFEKAALENITAAVDALDAFETPQGAVSYWRNGDSDAAVTAHALSFLADTSPVVPVDADQMNRLASWLEKQQPTGAREKENLLVAGLTARALAAAQRAGARVTPAALIALYHSLAQATDASSEPYMLAEFVLAAIDSGDESILGDAAARLAALAREEQGALYWDVRTNTPFYGWGTAGRVETSALAVNALAAWRARHSADTQLDSVIRRGLVFLLRHRDQLGGWSSTQATVRAMQAIANAAGALGGFGGKGGSVEVWVNGRVAKTIPLPDDPRWSDPIALDLSAFLATGDNHVELIPSEGAGATVVRATATHWLPWSSTRPRSSNELRFSVAFDHSHTSVGDTILCSVKAERAGFHGYGMMLAEIGLPPGADVDRSSLEKLLEDYKLGVYRYDVLPDRVAFYLWPEAGGISFQFGFRARLPMQAKSAASRLYDYYNPEQLTEAEPETLIVR